MNWVTNSALILVLLKMWTTQQGIQHFHGDHQGVFPMWKLIVLFLVFGSVFTASAQQAAEAKPDSVATRASILEEKYCRGDADVFTISLKLKIEVVNSTTSDVNLLWPMVPWVGKVASSAGDAESGHFLYEQTASYYLQGPIHFDRMKIGPAKKATVPIGYYLIARRDPKFFLSKSVSAGRYALVLVLSPEEVPPSQLQGPETLQSITTDPFLVDVPTDPKLVECESGAKAR
ncbi:MAG TPA: hypothetical protein VI386_34940 [Candidatus Sulfotelmatobacter sp.]